MKNSVAQYLLAAMAHEAAYVARDQGYEYSSLVTFGRTAVAADKLSDLCQEEGDCTKETARKIRRFLNRDSFGADVWYRNWLNAALAGKKAELEDYELEEKLRFDVEFKKVYKLEPPNPGES